jgi:oxygen-independent coproporphyrinogen-3 oxidase
MAQEAGFENISIDLMYALPTQTTAQWEADIETALRLNVQHISCYGLMYEEGTVMTRMRDKGELTPIDEDTENAMYDYLCERLEKAGFVHYEVSNFALPGHEAQHNSNYWNGTPYYGIGAAAHSYGTFLPSSPKNEGKLYRYWNVSDIHQYIQAIEQDIIPFEFEELNADTRYNDLITTALRTKEGIFLPSLEPRYHKYLMENAKTAINNGLLQIDDNHIHLTRQGLFVSDDVMSNLVKV